MTGNVNRLLSTADQVHFDTPLLLVIGRSMAKPGKFKVTPELAIDPPQQIEVESRRDAFSIIVCCEQSVTILTQIHTDQKCAAGTQQAGKRTQ